MKKVAKEFHLVALVLFSGRPQKGSSYVRAFYLIKSMEWSTRYIDSKQSSITESFSVSFSHSGLSSVML